MIGDMYTDLERSLYLHLTNMLTTMGSPSIVVHVQQPWAPEIDQSNHPAVINISKILDRFAPENGGGMQARLVTKDQVTGEAQVSPWPDGYLVGYDFIVYANDLELMRTAEFAIREAFKPRKPVFLYDTTDPDNPVLTTSYADLVISNYFNRDDTVERRYQRHLQINFEVFNYSNAVAETKPLITEIQNVIELSTPAEQTQL